MCCLDCAPFCRIVPCASGQTVYLCVHSTVRALAYHFRILNTVPKRTRLTKYSNIISVRPFELEHLHLVQ